MHVQLRLHGLAAATADGAAVTGTSRGVDGIPAFPGAIAAFDGFVRGRFDGARLARERAEDAMTENEFKSLFIRFLDEYWGAFHEALEAQSVTPKRLARSLLDAVRDAHEAFARSYGAPGARTLDQLGGIWRAAAARAYTFPDPPFTRDEVATAVRLFGELYDTLIKEGKPFAATRDAIVRRAPHGTPKQPLRADAAR
jgi:hypothetical protein